MYWYDDGDNSWGGPKTTTLYRSVNDFEEDNPYIFTYEINEGDTCCGIREYCNFEWGTLKGSEFKEVFAAIKAKFEEDAHENRYGFVHLTLLRTKDHQGRWRSTHPGWFLLFLKQYPGATHSEWRANPNTGNKLQFWVLPV